MWPDLRTAITTPRRTTTGSAGEAERSHGTSGGQVVEGVTNDAAQAPAIQEESVWLRYERLVFDLAARGRPPAQDGVPATTGTTAEDIFDHLKDLRVRGRAGRSRRDEQPETDPRTGDPMECPVMPVTLFDITEFIGDAFSDGPKRPEDLAAIASHRGARPAVLLTLRRLADRPYRDLRDVWSVMPGIPADYDPWSSAPE